MITPALAGVKFKWSMNVLLHPTYFPNLAHFVALIKSEAFTFEMLDNYQKQTYRNRMYIYGANGKLQLNVPVHHTQKNRQLYKDVKISNDTNWQDLHLKSLQSAYRTSPFFEFYEDELQPLFMSRERYLLDFNLKCLATVFECLQLPFNYKSTETFEKSPIDKIDLRSFVKSKKEIAQQFDPYTQVFNNKHGFINNLSILDLLFNEGPNTINYLETQQFLY